jgi:hypothetical protein
VKKEMFKNFKKLTKAEQAALMEYYQEDPSRIGKVPPSKKKGFSDLPIFSEFEGEKQTKLF